MKKYPHLLTFSLTIANIVMAQLPSKKIKAMVKTAVDSKFINDTKSTKRKL